jgi:hypothetical protein
MKQFKWHILYVMFLSIIEMGSRLGFSILFQYLLDRVTHISEGDNMKISYIVVICCGVIWLIGQIGRHNAYY